MWKGIDSDVFVKQARDNLFFLLKERNQVEELVAKIADEDANEAKARAEKQMEQLDLHGVG